MKICGGYLVSYAGLRQSARMDKMQASLGFTLDRPRLMGIINVTPDSFSDGGLFDAPETAVAQAQKLVRDGADILDLGGESTRPGARVVPPDEEQARVIPVIEQLRAAGLDVPISIDTRNAATARAALAAGATLVNDVSGLTYDREMAAVVAEIGCPVVIMHAKGTPETMQHNPQYEDVVADVYEALARQIDQATNAGIARDLIVTDPGIGFGKTLEHNVTLMKHLARFHDLGCPVLLGASRKRFIGTLSGVETASERVPGSLAAALFGAAQGVQLLRVHDVAETKQALDVWMAIDGEDDE